MSDLIERLRGLAKQVRPFDAVQALTYSDCADELEQAADEIERLQAVVDAAKAYIYRPENTAESHKFAALHNALAAHAEIERLQAALRDIRDTTANQCTLEQWHKKALAALEDSDE